MTLQNKGRAEEQLHANKNEDDFNFDAKRNKLLGLWLAEIFGIADAEGYAKEVVISDLDEPGDNDVLRKVMKDLANHDVDMSEDDIRAKMKTLMAEIKAAN